MSGTKDATATMGAVLPEEAHGRDAVHVAVFSASSHTFVKPGQHVSILQHGAKDALVAPTKKDCVGIVDPFVGTKEVKPGERFWVYLYPRSITALNHQWKHPAFDDSDSSYVSPATKLASEQWLRDYCKKADCPAYETLIPSIEKSLDAGGEFVSMEERSSDNNTDDYYGVSVGKDCIHVGGIDAGGEIPPEFWDHMQIVLGRIIRKRPGYFSCSC